MKIPKGGSSVKQMAYAMNKLAGKGETKKELALISGFSPSVAVNAGAKIERSVGFHNAMAVLAEKSNNLALKVMHEFEARGIDEFTNKELISALNAISGAWQRFQKGNAEAQPKYKSGENRLRTVILQQVENQVINAPPAEEAKEAPVREMEIGEVVGPEISEEDDF